MKIDYCVCINIKKRRDRATHIKKQIQKYTNIDIKGPNFVWYHPEKHENPVRGCAESHQKALEIAKEKKWPYVLVLEDDCKFLKHLDKIPEPPVGYDVLYLGANIIRFKDEDNVKLTKLEDAFWMEIGYVLSSHAILISEKMYDPLINLTKSLKPDDEDYNTPLDVLYGDYFFLKNKDLKSYQMFPSIATQKQYSSDIDSGDSLFNDYMITKRPINKCEYEIDEKDGNIKLIVPDVKKFLLPPVSVICPSRNRQHFMPWLFYNFEKQDYFSEMELLIIDDSNNEEELGPIENYFPYEDERVRVVHLRDGKHYTVGEKRNIGVREAKHDYIIHMDDDDFYYKEYITYMMKYLVMNERYGIKCVGTSEIGCYDSNTDMSFLIGEKQFSYAEACMGYTKEFWEERNYRTNFKTNEGIFYIHGREEECLEIPYQFLCIAITHSSNLTGEARKWWKLQNKHREKGYNFYLEFDPVSRGLFGTIKRKQGIYLKDEDNKL